MLQATELQLEADVEVDVTAAGAPKKRTFKAFQRGLKRKPMALIKKLHKAAPMCYIDVWVAVIGESSGYAFVEFKTDREMNCDLSMFRLLPGLSSSKKNMLKPCNELKPSQSRPERSSSLSWNSKRVDAAPFKQWYLQHYGVEIGRKKKSAAAKKEGEEEGNFKDAIKLVIDFKESDLKPEVYSYLIAMTTLVSDFGISRLVMIVGGNTPVIENMGDSTANLLSATIGYIAPEYGFGSGTSIKGDVYSFGVLVLEMVTRKRPYSMMTVKLKELMLKYTISMQKGVL
ncbi:hypothetical protein POM88_039109 [Heracleum sosnowskyi]|uniref:Protein kinase domain-containing protein n=1 Tax=Heracleum sosnowskyi TaxID=360622 RepID=A0AAD8HBN5_9APIA|nr:hypothetical protein POM88_039109 [Heracleum sosnowskyi]